MQRQFNKSQLNNMKDNQKLIWLDKNNNVMVEDGKYEITVRTLLRDKEEVQVTFLRKEWKPGHFQMFEMKPSGKEMHNDQIIMKRFFRAMKVRKVEQRVKGFNMIMYKRIFIGLEKVDKNGNDILVKPSLNYMVYRFPMLDVESIAAELWLKLTAMDKDFNYTYWMLKLQDKCKKEYNKEVTRLKRERKGLSSGDIPTRLNQPEDTEAPEIAWNEPLNGSEALMVSYLMEGLGQRAIYDKYRVHPATQQKLRKSIEKKMEII